MKSYTRLKVSITCILLCLLLAVSTAMSQDKPPKDEDYDNLARKGKAAQEELEHLEKLMLKIAERIEKKQPENADKLRKAWKEIHDRLILEDMRQIREALLRKELVSPFFKTDRVVKNLLEILEQITGAVRERTRGDELDYLDRIIEEVDKHKRDQEDLYGRTKKGEENLAPEQGKLKDRTGKTAGKVNRHGSPQEKKAGRLLDGAGEDMERAQEKLREGRPGAGSDQENALEKLDRAKRELVKRKEELEWEQTLSALSSVAGKLRKMLETQLEINRKTSDFDNKKRQEELARQERLEILRLGRTEKLLGEEAVELAKKLEKEKTHVFASALRGIAADMNETAALLRDQETGSYTRLLQEEIVAQLRRLVKALEELPRPPSPDPPKPPDGPKRPPHPPVDPPSVLPVAELKLLRGIEADIYEKTMEVHRAIKQCGGKPNFIQKKMIARLAHRQVRLTEMTRKLRESLGR
jgi:hypothetical protein